jgi:hypothetical protein
MYATFRHFRHFAIEDTGSFLRLGLGLAVAALSGFLIVRYLHAQQRLRA